MYSWIVRRALGVLVKQLQSRDVDKLSNAFADEAVLVFPGRNSFAGEHRGKPAIRAWIERFVALRPSFQIHDAAVAGPPWNMRVCFRFSDRIPIPDGGEYRNEGMEYLRIRWGRTTEQRVYLDTERVADLDERLAAAAA